MNCQDIALILDDGDIGRLDPQVRRAADAHAATCADCAADWQVHARLVDKALPSMPPGLAAGCRALAMAPSHGIHARGRLVVVGSVVALAAAAALLGAYFTQTPQPVIADVQLVIPVPTEVAPVAIAPAAQPVASPEVTQNPAPPAATASSRFTVRVVQLKNEATSDAGKAAIDIFNNTLLARLRAIPGLVLLMPDDAGDPGAEPDFRLTSRGAGPLNGKEFAGTIGMETLRAGKVTGITALSFAACAPSSPADSACDPAGQADRLVQMMRSMAFPPDPTLMQQQYTALADKSQDPKQRLGALEEIRMSRSALHAPPGTGTLDDPAVVRAAIELGAAADPAVRARVWRIMGESRSAELIPPLLAASRDQDSDVRIAAITALGLRHVREPPVRAALEGIARDDTRPLVRALASRAINGEEGWKQYVGASLRDNSRTEQERVEALVHHFARLRSPPQKFVEDVLKDDETIRALAETLPKWQHRSDEDWSHVWNVMGAVVQSVEHPAIGAMIAEGLKQEGRKAEWLLAAERLLQKGPDSRVQAALQKVARDDANADARAGAANLLKLAPDAAVPAP